MRRLQLDGWDLLPVSEVARHAIVVDEPAPASFGEVVDSVKKQSGVRSVSRPDMGHDLIAGICRDRAQHGVANIMGRDVLLDHEFAQLGRFAVTLGPRDLNAFKTPGLRNVACTAPYMHDGSVAMFSEAVDLEAYRRGIRDARPIILTPAERITKLDPVAEVVRQGADQGYGSQRAMDARPVLLTPAERDDLIAFLHALTSDDAVPVP